MKYAIDTITAEELIEKIEEQGLVEDICSDLFGFESGYSLFIKMRESGVVYTNVATQNTSWRHEDCNPELINIPCGWNLRDTLCEDLDFREDDMTGHWHIEGHSDAFKYWCDYYLNESFDFKAFIEERFDYAKENHTANMHASEG